MRCHATFGNYILDFRRFGTIENPVWSTMLKFGVLIWAVIVAGCVSTIEIEDQLEATPVFDQIDAKVGVVATAQARTAVLAGDVLSRGAVGQISVERFHQVFEAMFSNTIELPDWPPWQTTDIRNLDGVIQLETALASVSMGDDFSRPDEVSVTYRVCLYGNDGVEVNCWESSTSISHQRAPFECFPNTGPCLERQLELAVRDVIAKIMVLIEADQRVRQWEDAIARNDVGLVWWPADPENAMYGFSKSIEKCLSKRLADSIPNIRLHDHMSVKDQLYPLLEFGTQPGDEQSFAELLRRDAVRLRLLGIDLDYLVAFSGETVTDNPEGGILCGGGYMAAGCFGFSWASKETVLHAAVWNLMNAEAPQHVDAIDEGTTIVPAFILPVPIPAQTQSDACRELGDRIAAVINDRSDRSTR